MSLLDDFTAVDFSELTPSGIEEMVITAYEEASGQTVYPGDPVRLFLQSNAYIISLLAAFINETGNQQYLAHARGPHQDLIGALVDTARLPGQPVPAPCCGSARRNRWLARAHPPRHPGQRRGTATRG